MEKNLQAKTPFLKKHLKTIIVIAALIALIFYLNENADSYIRRTLNLCAIYAIIALSMNLVNGFTGQFSLGQAGFMAVGAYAVAIFTTPVASREAIYYLVPMHPALANIEIPFAGAVLLGGVVAAIFGFLIGAPCLRLRGDYLAIATLGFSEIIRIVFTNTQSITNGALGIKGIPTISSLWVTFGVLALVVVFLLLLINSTYGRAFKSIREDEIAAEAMGIGLFKHKMLAFVLSAFFTGIGGGLFAGLLGTVDPKQFYFTLTYNFLLIIVLGGMGSISGTVIASFIVTAGLEWLRFLDEPQTFFGITIPLFRPGLRMVIFSVLLMLVVLFYSRGLMGDKELTWDFLGNLGNKIKAKFTRKKGGENHAG